MSVYGSSRLAFYLHSDILAFEPNQGLIQFSHAFDYSLNALSGRERSASRKGVHSHDDALRFKLKRASYVRGIEFYGVFQQDVLVKPKPIAKTEKDPEVFLRKAVALTQYAPRADIEEIEAAIRAYGDALVRQERQTRSSKRG